MVENNVETVGLYIHWPFCIKKCHYCDLNSHVRSNPEYEAYVQAICDELRYWHQVNPNWVIKTIFFGGGTPSLMKPEWIEKILNSASIWTWNVDEITIEANPTVDKERLVSYHALGINRISFGVQSFDPDILVSLGRDHTSEQAYKMIEYAKTVFNNVSLDLMFALPGQTTEVLKNTLQKALELQPQHMSCYSLSLEENTLFGRLHREGKLQLASDDTFCEQYELVYDSLTKAGYEQYELSNFSKPGLSSEHNLIYWEYLPFLGIGPGAHSRLNLGQEIYAVENYKIPEQWLKEVHEKGCGLLEKVPLQPLEIMKEKVMMKLRLNKGMGIEELCETVNMDINHKIVNLASCGDINMTDTDLNLTIQGFMRYNSVINYLTT